MQKKPLIFLWGSAINKKRNCPFGRVPSFINPLLATGKRGTLPKAAAGCETGILKSIGTFFNQAATPRLPGFPCLISTLLYCL